MLLGARCYLLHDTCVTMRVYVNILCHLILHHLTNIAYVPNILTSL